MLTKLKHGLDRLGTDHFQYFLRAGIGYINLIEKRFKKIFKNMLTPSLPNPKFWFSTGYPNTFFFDNLLLKDIKKYYFLKMFIIAKNIYNNVMARTNICL